MKRKPKKIQDPAKLAAMRERMAKARAAKQEKQVRDRYIDTVANVEDLDKQNEALLRADIASWQPSEQDAPPPEAAAGENDGLPSFPVVDSAPSPAAPSEGGDANATHDGSTVLGPTVAAPSSDPTEAAQEPPVDAPQSPPEPPQTEWPSYMPVAFGELQEMTVQSLPQNPSLVLCSYSGRDGVQHVHVGVHDNFVKGMKLKAIIHPTKPAMWMLHGALPRFKGRW